MHRLHKLLLNIISSIIFPVLSISIFIIHYSFFVIFHHRFGDALSELEIVENFISKISGNPYNISGTEITENTENPKILFGVFEVFDFDIKEFSQKNIFTDVIYPLSFDSELVNNPNKKHARSSNDSTSTTTSSSTSTSTSGSVFPSSLDLSDAKTDTNGLYVQVKNQINEKRIRLNHLIRRYG